MATTDENTNNLGLPLPHATNELAVDVERLRQTIQSLDSYVAGLSEAIAQKAATGHTHEIDQISGLQSIISDLQNAATPSSLGDLDNVDAGSPVNYQFLMWQSNVWIPAAIQIGHVASLTATLNGKAATGHGHVSTEITDFGAAVDARIQAIVDAAPANLDTLNEIAAALGDDANFAATMTANLAGKANVTHSHSWSDISGKPSTFSPSSHGHSWGEISGKPSTFPPISHTHDDRYYTESEINSLLAGKAASSHSHSWASITSKPSFAEFYTGSSSTNTNYPIGTIVLVYTTNGSDGPGSINQSATVGVYSGSYFRFSFGSTLSGTWRKRGYDNANGTLMQRVA